MAYAEKCKEEIREWDSRRLNLSRDLVECLYPSIPSNQQCQNSECNSHATHLCLSCHHQLQPVFYCNLHIDNHSGLGHHFIDENHIKRPSRILHISCGCSLIPYKKCIKVFTLRGSQNINVSYCDQHSVTSTLAKNSMMGCHPTEPGNILFFLIL